MKSKFRILVGPVNLHSEKNNVINHQSPPLFNVPDSHFSAVLRNMYKSVI